MHRNFTGGTRAFGDLQTEEQALVVCQLSNAPRACANLSGLPPGLRINAKHPTGNVAPNLPSHVPLGALGLPAWDSNPVIAHPLMRPALGFHFHNVSRLATVSVQMRMRAFVQEDVKRPPRHRARRLDFLSARKQYPDRGL
jgi:hypothetical protein